MSVLHVTPITPLSSNDSSPPSPKHVRCFLCPLLLCFDLEPLPDFAQWRLTFRTVHSGAAPCLNGFFSRTSLFYVSALRRGRDFGGLEATVGHISVFSLFSRLSPRLSLHISCSARARSGLPLLRPAPCPGPLRFFPQRILFWFPLVIPPTSGVEAFFPPVSSPLTKSLEVFSAALTGPHLHHDRIVRWDDSSTPFDFC